MATNSTKSGDKLLGRAVLKSLFEKGKKPTNAHFASLIESMINKVDDRISKDIKNGLEVSAEVNAESKTDDPNKLLSFKKRIQDELPVWSFEMPNDDPGALAFQETLDKDNEKTRLYFKKGGHIGIGTTSPRTPLEVNGILGAYERIGTYKLGTVPADGHWHDVVTDVNGCAAFEIVAQVGKEHTGKYALLHAHALSTFGWSRHKIRKTQASYNWWWWNRLSLRWTGTTYKYRLQIRTRSNYGKDVFIKYHVSSLWNDNILNLFESKSDGGTQG